MDTPRTSSGKPCKLCASKGSPCHLHARVSSGASSGKASADTSRKSSPTKKQERGLKAMEEHYQDEKFFLAMLRSNPKDILSFCQADKKMTQLCKKQRVIETLINHFFPYRTVNKKNLYREFVRLANTTTIYVVDSGHYEWAGVPTKFGFVSVPSYQDKEAYLTNMKADETWSDDMANIEIMGSPFEKEVKLWVMMHDFDDRGYSLLGYDKTVRSPKVYTFRTRTEAIQSTAELIFGVLFEYLDDKVRSGRDGDFATLDDAAKNFKLPTPFSVQSLTLALEEYGFVTLQTKDPSDVETFTVRELNFTQTRIEEIYPDDEEE